MKKFAIISFICSIMVTMVVAQPPAPGETIESSDEEKTQDSPPLPGNSVDQNSDNNEKSNQYNNSTAKEEKPNRTHYIAGEQEENSGKKIVGKIIESIFSLF